MTDDQTNQAIAKACGWKPKRQSKLTRTGHFKVSYENPPNYCSDLNAMAEAEKVLCEQKAELYFFVLHDVAGNLMYHRATARQRAEAFLRTLGKWEPTTEDSSAVHLRDATKMMGEAQP